MAETYDIKLDDSLVGTAQVEKQGLYYLFSCRCRLPEEGLYRIHVISGDKHEDLGICVPVDGFFGMDKKIPAKRLGEGAFLFELRPRDWKPCPVVPEHKNAPAETVPEEETQPEAETVIPEPEAEHSSRTVAQERFIPVSEEEPFDYLDKLENARMEIRDDTPGIVIEMEEEA